MLFLFLAFAVFGFFALIANLLPVVGSMVIAFLKYIVAPLLIMGFIVWVARGGI